MHKRILVIEDEEIIASMLKDTLELMGHEVVVALSGLEGLRRAETLKPDVITLDVMMPGLDGLQVLKELKGSEATKNIPVILVSIAGTSYMTEGLKLGAVAFFRKPLNFKSLNEKIQQLTEEKRIMVVEDNPEVLKLLEVKLGSLGYSVCSVNSEEDIVRQAEKNKPDIILMDILLPKEDGFSITAKLKNNKETAKIPVIAFSGYFSDDIAGKSVIGVDKFIGKNFSVEELAEEVGNILKGSNKSE